MRAMHEARVCACIVVCSQLSVLQTVTALLQHTHDVTSWEDALVIGNVTPCSCELRRHAQLKNFVHWIIVQLGTTHA